MKYRCLTDDELKELEEEFKLFLIANNVYTQEWEKLNKSKDKRVLQLVEQFSDIVLEKALSKICYIEHLTSKDIKSFKCEKDKMILIGITSKNQSTDFTKDKLSDIKDDLSIFKTNKSYLKQREMEVFELIQIGRAHV